MKLKLISLILISGISISPLITRLSYSAPETTISNQEPNSANNLNWTILKSGKPPITDNWLKSWSENPKVAWNDFRSTPPKNSKNIAYTYTILDYSYLIKSLPQQKCKFIFTEISTQGLMVTFNSWAKQKNQNDQILNHEQGHFDIAQINALKLKQNMKQNLMGKNFDCANISISTDKTTRMDIIAKELTENLYQSVTKGWYAMDKKYDLESGHGFSVQGQDKWDSKLKYSLKNTN